MARRLRRCLVVSLDRHHSGARAQAPLTASREAIQAARRAGVRVSVDLNYRQKLWSEREAQQTMRPLVSNVDLVIANEEDLQSVLGIEVRDANVTSGSLAIDAYRDAATRVAREFSVPRVAVTLRESLSASDNAWSGVLFDAVHARVPSEPALRRAARRSHRRRRQLCRRSHLRVCVRPRSGVRVALRRRGQRAQANDPRRLQSRVGCRGRTSRCR